MKKYGVIFCILAILAVTFWYFKFPIKEAFHTSLVKLRITKRCYDKNRDFEILLAQEGLDYAKNDRQVTASSLAKLLNTKEGELRIPTISHHVYFTSTETPVALSEFYVENIRNALSKLSNMDANWQHFIWTNMPSVIPAEIQQLPGVSIKQLDEFVSHPLHKTIADIVDKGNFSRPNFAEGSDLIRLMALQKFGGMYNDMDYEIYNPQALYSLMRKFDFLGGREMAILKSFYGNAFIAAKPNHPVVNEALRLVKRNYYAEVTDSSIPDYIKYPCRETTRIYFNGPPLMTLSYFLANNQAGNNDVILPSWMIFNAKFAHSKNNLCNYASMPKTEFIQKNERLNQLLQDFRINFKMEGGESNDPALQNIYYSYQYNQGFPVIGADMFCGSWVVGKKFNRKYYWNWQ